MKKLEKTIQKLAKVMDEELELLREMLSSHKEEQHTILENNSERLDQLLAEREPLLEKLLQRRSERAKAMRQLTKGESDGTPTPDLCSHVVKLLQDQASADACHVLCLRDQMMALLKQLQIQTERNRYLIENRVAFTKEMIRRLFPCGDNPTYGKDGTVGQSKRCAVALINREV